MYFIPAIEVFDWIHPLSVVIGAFLGVMLNQYLSKRKERNKNAFAIYRKYHSKHMIKARTNAWNYFFLEYYQNPVPFHQWFTDSKSLNFRHYPDLVMVLYFWHEILVMKNEELINESLVRRLLGYQWEHWHAALSGLHQATRNAGGDHPEWMKLFEPGNMDWLDNGSPTVKIKAFAFQRLANCQQKIRFEYGTDRFLYLD